MMESDIQQHGNSEYRGSPKPFEFHERDHRADSGASDGGGGTPSDRGSQPSSESAVEEANVARYVQLIQPKGFHSLVQQKQPLPATPSPPLSPGPRRHASMLSGQTPDIISQHEVKEALGTRAKGEWEPHPQDVMDSLGYHGEHDQSKEDVIFPVEQDSVTETQSTERIDDELSISIDDIVDANFNKLSEEDRYGTELCDVADGEPDGFDHQSIIPLISTEKSEHPVNHYNDIMSIKTELEDIIAQLKMSERKLLDELETLRTSSGPHGSQSGVEHPSENQFFARENAAIKAELDDILTQLKITQIKISDERKQLQETSDSNKDTIKQLQDENNKLKEMLRKSDEYDAVREAEISSLKKQLDGIKESASNFTEVEKLCETLNYKLVEVEEENKRIIQESETTREELDTLRDENSEIKRKHEDAESAVREEIALLQERLQQTTERHNNSLREAETYNQELRMEKEKLMTRLRTAERTNTEMQQDVELMRTQLTEVQSVLVKPASGVLREKKRSDSGSSDPGTHHAVSSPEDIKNKYLSICSKEWTSALEEVSRHCPLEQAHKLLCKVFQEAADYMKHLHKGVVDQFRTSVFKTTAPGSFADSLKPSLPYNLISEVLMYSDVKTDVESAKKIVKRNAFHGVKTTTWTEMREVDRLVEAACYLAWDMTLQPSHPVTLNSTKGVGASPDPALHVVYREAGTDGAGVQDLTEEVKVKYYVLPALMQEDKVLVPGSVCLDK